MALSNKKTLPFQDKSEYKKGSGVMFQHTLLLHHILALEKQ
jgi:hypothetical protein